MLARAWIPRAHLILTQSFPVIPTNRQNKSPEAPVKFQAIAKAYKVLMNETHRELYHHFQEHPDVRAGCVGDWSIRPVPH